MNSGISMDQVLRNRFVLVDVAKVFDYVRQRGLDYKMKKVKQYTQFLK